jgi:hypothetical protein
MNHSETKEDDKDESLQKQEKYIESLIIKYLSIL